ncbi:winged helix-turn-helix transcriptional regulator [Methanobrevibacter sp.]|uniref:winged helix-turn-helix transcriptional regulator n=1 Tax=Methanobrevibacter sp. TaxID=66852 RepID=UPI00386A3781
MTLNPRKLEYYERKYERNPVEEAVKYLSNKWTLHILRDLFLGKSRFNEFKANRKSLDNKSLSRCLKTMENNGLIYKVIDENDSRNTQYFLTDKGRSFNRVFYELLLFAIENDEDNEFYSDYEKDDLKEMYKEILEIA